MALAEGPLSTISIHALREESDVRSTVAGAEQDISIHALREESDLVRRPIM